MAHGGDVAIARLVVRNASFRRHDRRQRPAPRRCQYQHWAPYAQVNVGVAREFLLPDDPKPMTLRFDVVNLFDTIYQLRDGSGIGVFATAIRTAPGYFAGTSKKF